jgi:hypothetical protein
MGRFLLFVISAGGLRLIFFSVFSISQTEKFVNCRGVFAPWRRLPPKILLTEYGEAVIIKVTIILFFERREQDGIFLKR